MKGISEMNLQRCLVSVLLFAVPVMADAAGASDIVKIFGRDPGSQPAHACFTRHYTKAHLAGHPDQNVTDMRMFVNKAEGEEMAYTVDMQVDFREQKRPLVLSNYCEPGDAKHAITCPFDCEGGRIDMRVKSQSAILVEIPLGARVYDPPVEDGVPVRGKFGEDDKLFRLDRADLSDCLPAIKDEKVRAAVASGAITQ
jgi:hypothetical protein